MCCILTYRTIMEIYGRIMRFAQTHPSPTPIKTESPGEQPPPPPSYMSKLLPLGHRKDLVSIAKNIAQTVEFSIQEDKKSQGPGMFRYLSYWSGYHLPKLGTRCCVVCDLHTANLPHAQAVNHEVLLSYILTYKHRSDDGPPPNGNLNIQILPWLHKGASLGTSSNGTSRR